MAAVRRNAGGMPARTGKLIPREKVMLAGLIAWAIAGLLVIGLFVVGH